MLLAAAVGVSAALLAGVVLGADSQPRRWSVTDLGTLPGHRDGFLIAVGINNAGEAIGESDEGPLGQQNQQAFLWRDGKLEQLTRPGSAWPSGAVAINSRGDIAGDAVLSGGRQPSILWRNGKATVLGTLGGKTSYPIAMNDSDEVVGQSQIAGNRSQHAFLWRDGRMIDLGTLGGSTANPTAISDRGQVIGDSTTASGATHAFLWQSGRMTDLGSLPGLDSHAAAINDSGEIVGMADTRFGNPVDALDWKDGKLVDLGRFGAQGADAIGVNDSGHILVELISGGSSTALLLEGDKHARLPSLGGGVPQPVALHARSDRRLWFDCRRRPPQLYLAERPRDGASNGRRSRPALGLAARTERQR